MDAKFSFGSLFSGIGGIDLGLERAGMECKWQVEIDPYASKVLEKHWPNVRRYSDVKECGESNLDPVDLICGGFPCQDISYAGKGAGITGERSGLWKEFYRIICELRPRYVLVENVPALLRRGLNVVLGDLASCGYNAEWEGLPAAAFGAPHRRDRIFVVAHANQRRLEGPNSFRRNGGDAIWQGSAGMGAKNMAYPKSEYGERAKSKGDQGGKSQRETRNGSGDMANIESGQPGLTEARDGWQSSDGRGKEINESQWAIEPNVGRVANGVPSRVDRLKCLGNAVVPQVAEYIGRKILDF